MKYHLDDIIALYKKLLEEVNVAEASVIIFTALDVDALCCLKMFSVNVECDIETFSNLKHSV